MVSEAKRKDLEKQGYRVKMTRNADRFVRLPDRGKTTGDLFVSLHCNVAASIAVGPDQMCSPKEMVLGTVLQALRAMSPEEIHAVVDEAIVQDVMES